MAFDLLGWTHLLLYNHAFSWTVVFLTFCSCVSMFIQNEGTVNGNKKRKKF